MEQKQIQKPSRLKNHFGFTLIEIVLYMAIAAIVVGVGSYALTTQMQSYAFIRNRQQALADARHAMNRMSREFRLLTSADITAASATSFSFTDSASNAATFSYNAGDNTVYRGADVLATRVSAFTFTYYDQNNNTTTTPADIRRIEFTLTTEAIDDEGTVTLTSNVTPRSFIYSNYN